ncbi:MAG: Gfo/Idh/MocA family oxidoreductase [Chloroflexi bacterium]|nr:Gfo/Idh/MocA family oxidoreductase [Chloroflexota bacterium]
MPRKLRFGIISTSYHYSLRVHDQLVGSQKVEPVAIASRSLDTACAYAADHGIPRAYGSYEELLADPEIDAVFNPLPNFLHAEWVIKAAEAGKHSLCEKPMGDDAAQVREMAAACEKNGVLLSEAFMFRFAARNRRAREIIASGELGRIWTVKAGFSFNVPRSPRNIRHYPEMAGGALADAGCYTVAAARFLLGAEPVAVLSSMHIDEEFGVDMSGSGILEFPGGPTALISYSMEDAGSQQIEVIGFDGRMVLDQFVISAGEPGTISVRANRSDVERVEHFQADLIYRAEFETFADAVRGEAELPFDQRDAIAQARVLDALRESARLERKVGLPPQPGR